MDVIITGIIGVITTIASWMLARKKYYSEVEHNLIENMQASLDFYKKLLDDNNTRLEETLKRNDLLDTEIRELKKQMLDLTMSICLDLTCANRIRNIEN